MNRSSPVPIVGVGACRRTHDAFPGHWVTEQYMEAVVRTSGCGAMIIPALGQRGFSEATIDSILDRLDGLLLTGSPSNVEPHHYDTDPFSGDLNDPDRDATTLPLIRGAVARGIPVLAICRGIQELNVAMGGSLHQKLHETPGSRDHRSDKTRPRIDRTNLRHDVTLVEATLLHAVTGKTSFPVNSLHAQGIKDLAPGARINAMADDGSIEAVDFPDSSGFVLGVQWHPEWSYADDSASTALFTAFGEAVQQYAGASAASAVSAAAE